MNHDHEELIDAVARSICISFGDGPDRQGDARGNDYRWQDYRDISVAALKAAADRGYALAKLPERITGLAEVPLHVQDDTMGTCRAAYRHGWSQCLDAIETITLDEEQENG